jgi:hypothetical protein
MTSRVREPFEPSGPQSRREMIVTFSLQFPDDTVITWADFGRIGIVQGRDGAAFQKAKQDLLRKHKRTLVAVRGVGYRITSGAEQITVAKKATRSAGRKLVIANDNVTHIATDSMTHAQIAVAVALRDLSRQAAVITGQARRLTKVESDVTTVKADVTLLRQQLNALGIPVSATGPVVVEGEVIEDDDGDDDTEPR